VVKERIQLVSQWKSSVYMRCSALVLSFTGSIDGIFLLDAVYLGSSITLPHKPSQVVASDCLYTMLQPVYKVDKHAHGG